MSFEDELPELINQLKDHGIEFDAGLSDAEVAEIEQTCKFQFPPDLKMFLQLGVPVRWVQYHNNNYMSDRFPNWREDPLAIMNDSREWAAGTFHFDIEHNHFWMERWGKQPAELEDAFKVVNRYLETVPVLIPIYAHRFTPAQPNLPGNPVFSVWQATDTIYYGYNLQNYLSNEFIRIRQQDWGKLSDYRHIPFWSDIVIDIGP
jgi:hypothetical protein